MTDGDERAEEPVGIYVHVPFCLTRCGYCDFNAYAGLDHLAPRYLRALMAEAALAVPGVGRGGGRRACSSGGGTPTMQTPEDLAALLVHLRETFDVAADAEITTEANPDTVDEASLRALRGAGYERLSMGAQSFDMAVLASLERLHSPDSVRAAFAAARAAGYDNVNLDLIYGANGETIESWERTLHETIALAPEHVSAYALTVEPATPLGRAVASGATPAPDPDLQADMFGVACELLGCGRLPPLRGLELGQARVRVPPQPRLLGAPALPGPGRRRALLPRRHPLVEHAPARGVHGARRTRRAPDRGRGASRSLRRLPRGGVPAHAHPRGDAGELDRRAGVGPFIESGLIADEFGTLVPTERGMLLLNELVLGPHRQVAGERDQSNRSRSSGPQRIGPLERG